MKRPSPRPQIISNPFSFDSPSTTFSSDPLSTNPTSVLRSHSLYIRETLPSLLAPTVPYLPPQQLYTLTMILAHISDLSPPHLTLDMLRESRIVKALNMIVTPFSEDNAKVRWPTDSFIQAKKILRKWERLFGDLGNLTVNLFAAGQRLYGLAAAKAHKITHRSVIVPDEVTGTIWNLIQPPLTHLGPLPGSKPLPPGSWHINLASLFSAGQTSHPSHGPITFDAERAYTIVLCSPSSPPIASPDGLPPKQLRETVAWDTGETVKFTVEGGSSLDMGAVRLMKTMGGGEEGLGVRVWRHWNWGGEWAPRGGVRFDGLYTITTSSVLLTKSPTRSWNIAFTLKRQRNQFPLASVMHIPMMDQMDDWEDFLALAAGAAVRVDNNEESVAEEAANLQGETIEGMEKVMRKKALARADTVAVVEESLLDAVRMGKEDGRRDSGYFGLATSESD